MTVELVMQWAFAVLAVSTAAMLVGLVAVLFIGVCHSVCRSIRYGR